VKKLPLGLQIWLVFASLFLVLSIVMILVLPSTLRSFFTNQIYLTIEDAQLNVLNDGLEAPFQTPRERDMDQQNFRTVRHIILDQKPNSKGPGPRGAFSPGQMETFKTQAFNQQEQVARYEMRIEDSSILYEIRKVNINNKTSYLFSYLWDTYPKELVKGLYSKLLYLILLILLVSWLPSMWLIRYVSKPLGLMVKQVKRIADRDWHEALAPSERGDEIGQLSSSIETMRQKLVQQDQAQQSFLQHISHELKTPIMVIRSYTGAIHEGIFPKGDLTGSIDVIDQEAERLEHRVQNLLYLTKLDYLRAHPGPEQVEFDLSQVIEETVERLRWKRPELTWQVELPAFTTWGYEEQWMIAMENLIDNQIRYAHTVIRIDLQENEEGRVLRVGNDGPPITEDTKAMLFQPFQKGKGGKFGLGLMIVKRTADLHQVEIDVVDGTSGRGVIFMLAFKPQLLRPLA
jgi:two-component system sensor histidine kinase CssS